MYKVIFFYAVTFGVTQIQICITMHKHKRKGPRGVMDCCRKTSDNDYLCSKVGKQ